MDEENLTELDGQLCHLECELHPDESVLWFTTELLESMFRRPWNFTHMTVSAGPPEQWHGTEGHPCWEHGCASPPGTLCFINAIVKITNGQRNWIYKVDEYDMCKDAWHSRWPD